MTTTPVRILVPTDLEPTTDSALALAAQLARRFRADLHLLHIRVLLDDAHLEDEHRNEIERLLATGDDHAADALQLGGVHEGEISIHRHLVRGVSAPEAIVATAAELGVDLIVMGTHGRRGLRHLLIGSVAEEVVRTAPAPVLTVRPGAAHTAGPVSRLLVPHDFSPRSLEAVKLAAVWAAALGATVILLHIVEPVIFPQLYAIEPLPDAMVDSARERSQRELAGIAAEHLAGVPYETIVTLGAAAEGIVYEATERRADLVVMASRGLSGLEHLLLGSVVEKVLRRSLVPLLTVRRENPTAGRPAPPRG